MPEADGPRLIVMPAQERSQLLQEDVPCRLSGEKNVVAGAERDKPRAGNFRSQDLPFFGRNHPIAVIVKDQSRHRDPGQEMPDVDLFRRYHDAGSILRLG